jgi:hypothetical protein
LAVLTRIYPGFSGTYRPIPYATEQGIIPPNRALFGKETGNLIGEFRDFGNSVGRAWVFVKAARVW